MAILPGKAPTYDTAAVVLTQLALDDPEATFSDGYTMATAGEILESLRAESSPDLEQACVAYRVGIYLLDTHGQQITPMWLRAV